MSKYKEHNLEIEAALGRAISRWGSIEGALCELFVIAVAARDQLSAFHAIDSINSAEVQIKAVNAALQHTYKDEPSIIAYWNQRHKEILNAKKLRAGLAHGQIIRRVRGEKFNVFFAPHYQIHHRKGLGHFKHWGTKRLNATADYFKAIHDELFDLVFFLHWEFEPGQEYRTPISVNLGNFLGRS